MPTPCPPKTSAIAILRHLGLGILLVAGIAWAGISAPPGSTPKEVRLGGDARLLPQEPLTPQKATCAVLLIGGFGDEVHGIMHHLAQQLRHIQTAPVAYYHWHAGCPDLPQNGVTRVAEEIATFRRINPGADIVLIGHSMGAATALKIAARLPEGKGRVYLITLDPIDSTCTPRRPACVIWWGNAYLTHSGSAYDFLLAAGGRWNSCSCADINQHFDGRQCDEAGRPYIHDHADSLLFSAGRGTSLYHQLLQAMKMPSSQVTQQAQSPQTQACQCQ